MNIPSNYSLEEIVKYVDLPEPVRKLLEEAAFKIIELEKEVKAFDRIEERLREQIYFRDEYIGQVVQTSKTTTKHKDLAKFIEITLENSYIEL
jgi:hypothetical protein